jgi:hypothetical protein
VQSYHIAKEAHFQVLNPREWTTRQP